MSQRAYLNTRRAFGYTMARAGYTQYHASS